MPNCFQLTRRDDHTVVFLQAVDAELAQHLDLPFHPKFWVHGWYDCIGFSVAMGKTLPELIDRYAEWETKEHGEMWEATHALYRIAAYLNEHYTTDAWAER